jgi:hypothetical protein
MGLRGLLRRYRGQTDASSWAAGTLARSGALVVLALLLVGCFSPTTASAASHHQAAEPSPQKAPAVSSSNTPAPDLAPQAVVTPHVSHSSPPPAPTRTAPVVVAPRIVAVTTPAQPSGQAAHTSTVSRTPAHRPSPRRTKVSHPSPRHAVATRTVAHPISLGFFLGRLPNDLLRLPQAALQAGEESHGGGVLLLLSSVAMGVLAVSSFALMRRLRRLEAR